MACGQPGCCAPACSVRPYGGRKLLPKSASVDLRRPPHDAILQDRLTQGFEYSIAGWRMRAWSSSTRWMHRARGARIETRTACTGIERRDGGWHATIEPAGGAPYTVTARAIVNAAGRG
jgi:glycerol-3-phosphate dehydrogenase